MKKKSGIFLLNSIFLLMGLVLFAACTGGGGGGGETSAPPPPGTTPTKPGAFNLTNPANNESVTAFIPSFSWQTSSGADSYILQIAEDNAFTSPLTYEKTAILTGTTSTTLPSDTLLANKTYYWRVTASNTAGSTNAGGSPAAFTFNASGALVASIASNPSVSFNEAFGIARDTNSLYIVGYDQAAGYSSWRIEKRSLADGTLVNVFGTNGVITGLTTTRSVANAIAIDGASMYVVGYEINPGGTKQWRIEKRDLTTGALVTGFNATGIVSSGTGTTDSVANAIAIDSQYMYVAGFDTTPGLDKQEWRIEKRSLINGSLETTSFGIGGIVTNHISTGNDIAYGIAVDANGIYIVGSDESAAPGTPGWSIEILDVSTGASTAQISEKANAVFDEALAVAIDSQYMYVVGYDSQTPLTDDQWRIEKRSLSNGSLVASFGTGGVIQENPSSAFDNSYDDAHAVAIDANYLYVAGYDSQTSSGDEEWRVEKRNLSDGSLVTSFGLSGAVTSNANPSPDTNFFLNEAWGIVTDSANIYVAGFDMTTTYTHDEWRMEIRSK